MYVITDDRAKYRNSIQTDERKISTLDHGGMERVEEARQRTNQLGKDTKETEKGHAPGEKAETRKHPAEGRDAGPTQEQSSEKIEPRRHPAEGREPAPAREKIDRPHPAEGRHYSVRPEPSVSAPVPSRGPELTK